ncbi:MAG: ArsR family transcriptional regulator [Halobacteriales archaeon]|nr:ArsR family transcriptional regulator [Halobacteriales archaeon]
MDSAVLLDLLGNENRRRILRLLARRPCYVTEISEYLAVSPKAVIDHLRKLEDAGLVESRVDEQRRKYFSIARNLRLEVNVSPYEFGTKSAYPASRSLDMTRCRYLSLHIEPESSDDDSETSSSSETDAEPGVELDADGEPSDDPDSTDSLDALAAELDRLETLENELSMAQRWVQGQLTDVMDSLSAAFGERDGRFYAELLAAVANGARTTRAVARRVDASPAVTADALAQLESEGLLEQVDEKWQFTASE